MPCIRTDGSATKLTQRRAVNDATGGSFKTERLPGNVHDGGQIGSNGTGRFKRGLARVDGPINERLEELFIVE